jgi:hypothetical protein
MYSNWYIFVLKLVKLFKIKFDILLTVCHYVSQ